MLTAKEAFKRSMEYKEDVIEDIFKEIDNLIKSENGSFSTVYKFKNREIYDLYGKRIADVLSHVYGYDVEMNNFNHCLNISWDVDDSSFCFNEKNYKKACEGCMDCMVNLYNNMEK